MQPGGRTWKNKKTEIINCCGLAALRPRPEKTTKTEIINCCGIVALQPCGLAALGPHLKKKEVQVINCCGFAATPGQITN